MEYDLPRIRERIQYLEDFRRFIAEIWAIVQQP